jgi:transposase
MGKSIQKLSSVTRVGHDLAKTVIQVHAVDANGEIVVARKLTRGRLVSFNQAELMRHRVRELLAGQRTAALNALSGHLAEIGVVARQGVQHASDLKRLAVDGFDEDGEVVVPDCVRVALRPLVSQIDTLGEAIGAIDKEIAMSAKADETAKRLMTIPGAGPVTASAITATIPGMDFASGREFAAFLGLTPRQSSTRREAAARAHHQDGRPLPAQSCWSSAPAPRSAIAKAIMMLCVCGRAGCSSARQSRTSQADRGRARQQGRAHRLRADDEGGEYDDRPVAT